jgi:hypothetical protein
LQRLYYYLVAALGLSAFVLGLAGDLIVLVRWLASGLQAEAALRSEFALSTAAWWAGLPVWLLAWVPAQRAAQRAGAEGIDTRRSTLRKLYLYAFALAAVVVALVSAITVVYQLLNAVFGLFEGGNVFTAVAQSFGYAVISTVVWLYHAWVLRGDGRFTRTDQAAAKEDKAVAEATAMEQRKAEWAGLPVAVIDDGDGSFGQRVMTALQRDLPYVTLIPISLNPAVAAALLGAVPTTLADASLIVTPSTAMGTGSPIAASAVPKIIVPINLPGAHWVGLNPVGEWTTQIARAVEQTLRTLPHPAPRPAEEGSVPSEASSPPVVPAADTGSAPVDPTP